MSAFLGFAPWAAIFVLIVSGALRADWLAFCASIDVGRSTP